MIKSLCQLVRLPNVFTVIADILVGYLFVHPDLTPTATFACLLAASICLYWSGMVLNDVFDLEQDRRERPQRPLPSGAISPRLATVLGWGLLVMGIALGAAAGICGDEIELPWRSGVMAAAIAACIVAYDTGLKRSWCGPLLMGACRTGNLLLGMSTGPVIWDYAWGPLGFDPAQLAVAGGLGIYVAGLTWFARNEAGKPRRGPLLWAGLVMLLGLILLATFTFQHVSQAGRYHLTFRHDWWPLIVLFLAVPIIRRVAVVVATPSPEVVQAAVRSCLLSLIVFDAAICLATQQPWGWSLLVLSLMIPTVLLGRLFYST